MDNVFSQVMAQRSTQNGATDDSRLTTHHSPTLLCILDGWGEGLASAHNAIAQARTPHWDALRAGFPFTTLEASETHVGLPEGQMGNSEVGHMNIGAGRVVMQDLPRIDAAIADGSLAQNAAMRQFIAALQQSGGTCHLLGLMSDGGVHAHQAHLVALARMVSAADVPVVIHAFADGRDTPPQSAMGFLQSVEAGIAGQARIRLGTLSGRYYAMDRDKRWDRVALAYAAIVEGRGATAPDGAAAIAQSYVAGKNDEFILPTVLGDYAGMQAGDGVLMGNFRADRAREILTALLDPAFDGFARPQPIAFAAALGLASYGAALDPLMPALFAPQSLRNNLGEWLEQHGKTQLRIAETEKYAHVTFFFSGGREAPYQGEERILIPSPKVATYDEQPEMSAREVTDALVGAIASQRFDCMVVNYANTDMVGHTGDVAAAVRAVEAVDACLGRLREAMEAVGGVMLITADHGNAECLHDEAEQQPHTAHTLNPVPCLLVGAAYAGKTGAEVLRSGGVLADLAPTLCAVMGLPQPAEMTGQSLLQEGV